MTIRTKKTLSWENLRRCCINNNYYDAGTNEEYENLFKMCEGEMTDMKIYEIALDIFEHTDDLEYRYSMYKDECIESIMFNVNDECYTFFTIER